MGLVLGLFGTLHSIAIKSNEHYKLMLNKIELICL